MTVTILKARLKPLGVGALNNNHWVEPYDIGTAGEFGARYPYHASTGDKEIFVDISHKLAEITGNITDVRVEVISTYYTGANTILTPSPYDGTAWMALYAPVNVTPSNWLPNPPTRSDLNTESYVNPTPLEVIRTLVPFAHLLGSKVVYFQSDDYDTSDFAWSANSDTPGTRPKTIPGIDMSPLITTLNQMRTAVIDPDKAFVLGIPVNDIGLVYIGIEEVNFIITHEGVVVVPPVPVPPVAPGVITGFDVEPSTGDKFINQGVWSLIKTNTLVPAHLNEAQWAQQFTWNGISAKTGFEFGVIDYKFKESWRIQNYEELKSLTWALKAVKIGDCSLSSQVLLKQLQFNLNVTCPIKENEWWGQVKSLGVETDGIPVAVFNLGVNGNIALYKKEGDDFIIAESDELPMIAFKLTLTGLLNEISRVTLVQQPTMGTNGFLGFVDDTNEDDFFAKVVNTVGGFDYLKTSNIDESDFPEIENLVYSEPTLNVTDAGKSSVENSQYRVIYNTPNIEVYLKKTVLVNNPVAVLRIIMLDYVKHDQSQLDDNPNDPVDVTTSWGYAQKRFEELNLKCTAIIETEINANNLVDELTANFGLVVFESSSGLISIKDLYPPEVDNLSLRSLTTNDMHNSVRKTPSVKTSFQNLTTIITDLTLRYNPVGNVYNKEILPEEFDSISGMYAGEIANLMTISKTHTNNTNAVSLNLKFTADKQTALYCAYLKMLFHHFPTRQLKIEVDDSWITEGIGNWVRIDGNYFIKETTDKAYLIIGNPTKLPMGNGKSSAILELQEFDWKSTAYQIQEIPAQSFNNNYNERTVETDIIQEVPDGNS